MYKISGSGRIDSCAADRPESERAVITEQSERDSDIVAYDVCESALYQNDD